MKKTQKKSNVAPMVEPDKSQLGDTHLNPEEAVIREREELLKMAAKSRVWGQDELEKAERSLGPRLPTSDLIARIKKLNHKIKFLDGSVGQVAVYRPLHKDEIDPESIDTNPNADQFFNDHKYVSGFPLGELPEWGHVTLDTSLLPTREHRGWRTVLIALIKSKTLTYSQVVKEFGEPRDERGCLWHQQLEPYKGILFRQ